MLVVSLLEQIKSYGNHVSDKKLVNHDCDEDTYDDAYDDTDDHNFREKDRYNAAGPAPDAGVMLMMISMIIIFVRRIAIMQLAPLLMLVLLLIVDP